MPFNEFLGVGRDPRTLQNKFTQIVNFTFAAALDETHTAISVQGQTRLYGLHINVVPNGSSPGNTQNARIILGVNGDKIAEYSLPTQTNIADINTNWVINEVIPLNIDLIGDVNLLDVEYVFTGSGATVSYVVKITLFKHTI